MNFVPTYRLIYLCAAVLLPSAALLAYAPEYSLWIAAGSLLLAIIAILDAARAYGSLDAIRVSVPNVVRATRGIPATVEITIDRPAAWPNLLHLGLALPDSVKSEQDELFVRLPVDTLRAAVLWTCTPTERGNFSLERIYLGAPSPWGFWEHRRAARVEGVLRAYPNVQQERKTLAALFLDRSAFGVHARRQVGKGREFEHLREYMPGDSFEDIHWKATARRGSPVTKMYQVERTQEVYVVIDSSRLSAATPGGEVGSSHMIHLERFINAALVLGLVAEKQGDLFGLITFDRRVNRFVKARTGRAHYNACRDAIYSLEPSEENADFADLFSFIRVRLRKRALLIVLTDLGDPMLAEQFCRHVDLVSRNHLVLVNAIADPQVVPVFASGPVESTDDIYARVGGHIEWSNLQKVRQMLHLRNVALHFTSHEALSAGLVSQYMDQKQRQLL